MNKFSAFLWILGRFFLGYLVVGYVVTKLFNYIAIEMHHQDKQVPLRVVLAAMLIVELLLILFRPAATSPTTVVPAPDKPE